MSDRDRGGLDLARTAFASPRFTQALTEVAIAVALCMHALRAVVGWPGALAVLVALVVLAGLSLAGQPERVEWRGILPLSLQALVGLMVVSIFWSQYTWASIGGVAYTLAFAFLGLYIALVRDTIQVVRGVGNALRFVLTASFALEIVSGILIDTPMRFLGIAGNLAEGGPVQGLAGTRNYFAFMGGLAVLNFWIEYRTRSVPRWLTWYSLALAAATIVFARSPVSWFVLGAVLTAGIVLVVIRRQDPRHRRATQATLLGAALVSAGVAWAFREQLVQLVDAATAVDVRTSAWESVQSLTEQMPVQGWGWVGIWHAEVYPFLVVTDQFGNPVGSALNAYVDVGLQLGFAGVILLVAALGLAIARAWLVASERRSTVHVWPALTLILLATTSVTESYLLFEAGFMLFVTSALVAARNHSWRRRL